jgi:phospholipid-binding lipoprotein MlaA
MRDRRIDGWRSLVAAISIVGCSGSLAGGPRAGNPVDPWEGMNRRIFWFNEQVDAYLLEPAATAWDFVAPEPVQRSIGNFFVNARAPVRVGNDLLQGKIGASASDTARFLVNTTAGVGGLFDPATRLGLESRTEDFGQTLGRWGVGSGPYLVLPLLGPSTVRDALGLPVDSAMSIAPFFVDSLVLLGANAAEAVNTRARVLQEVRDARAAALDFYVAARQAYLQRRGALVEDRERMSEAAQEELYYPGEEEVRP